MTRSISIAAARPTGCRAAASAPASCASLTWSPNAWRRWRRRSTFPVTVKCRIGVDEQEPRAALFAFADRVKAAGAAALIVHARKAWLEGLSPKDNRSIPPLDYELVHELKRAHAHWPIILNGGLADLDGARAHLAHVDGIMLGRAAYQNPELLIGVDPLLFGEPAPVADGFEAIEAFMPTIARGLERGERLHDYTRHLHGLFAGRPGARAFRQVLATEAVKRGAGLAVLRDAVRPGGATLGAGGGRIGRGSPRLSQALSVPCPSFDNQGASPATSRCE